MSYSLQVYNSPQDLALAAAQHIVSAAQEAIAQRGGFAVALSGGSTPQATFEILGRQFEDQISWDRVFIFWGDERSVPPDHPDSNYGMTAQTLLHQVPLPAENVFRMRGEMDPRLAASAYEEVLRGHFKGNGSAAEGLPRFDLILLGLGPDGHTASLFPGTSGLQEQTRWVVGNQVPQLDTWRITITFPVINAARQVVFLVSGGQKANRLAEILVGSASSDPLPAQRVAPNSGELIWMVDRDAAGRLQDGS